MSAPPTAAARPLSFRGMDWELIDAYEQLGPSGAKKAFGTSIDRWLQYAIETVPTLAPWQAVETYLNVYESPTNRTRFRRMLDHAVPGDKIVDIGLGWGYQTGIFMRDSGFKSYTGIEIDDQLIPSIEQMIAVNDFDRSSVELRLGDLYSLTPRDLADATLVMCCEVIEHVPDPEKALMVLGEALPSEADLLISVPLYRRLDNVWGHYNVFDAVRLRTMIAEAGLHVHYVQPVANTWAMALLARHEEPCERARIAASRGPEIQPRAKYRGFTDIDLAGAEAVSHGELDATISNVDGGVRCRVKERRPSAAGSAGVRIPVPGLKAGRIELGLDDIADVNDVTITGYVGSDRVAQWTWEPAKRPSTADRKSFLFYADHSGHFFKLVSAQTPGKIDHAEIAVRLKPGGTAQITVHRAAIDQ